MAGMFDTGCPLMVCDGSGFVPFTDWPSGGVQRCACRAGAYDPIPAEAERRALVVEGELRARRRAQELMHDAYNREGER